MRVHDGHTKRRFVSAAATLALLTAVAGEARADCTSDAECKGDRVCREGTCQDPVVSCSKDIDCPGEQICSDGVCKASAASAPPPSPEAAPPAPPAPAPAGPAANPAAVPPTMPVPVGTPATPTGYRTESHGIKGLLIAGPIVLGVSYLVTVAVTAAISDNGAAIGYSAIPLAGPWVMIGALDTGSYTGALVASGMLQAGGLTMLILGAAIRTEEQVPVYGLKSPELTILPGVGPDGVGLTAVGTF